MSAVIFDGRVFARVREMELARKLQSLRVPLRMGSICFVEDEASMMYTKLKRQAAVRVGIEFSVEEVSITESLPVLQDKVKIYCAREDLGGVLVQKPSMETWKRQFGGGREERFGSWWRGLVGKLEPTRDVDCLTEESLARVYAGQWRIVPATVKAVVSILVKIAEDEGILEGQTAGFDLHGYKIAVLGRSEIVGKPLAAVLTQYGAGVRLYGRDVRPENVLEAEVVVSATGVEGLVTKEMVRQGAVVIDVGAPRAEVRDEVREVAAVVTPVPGGVGPVTVVSLLENLVDLVNIS